MVRKSRGPDHIREHVEKRGYKHNYMLYSKGAYYYDLPYWTFVHLAKDAGATVDLHRMAVADTFAIDRYLDENCLVEPEKPSRKESVREMKAVVMASFIPVSPSAQMIIISCTPRFLRLFRTESQYLELSFSPTSIVSTSL